MPSFYRLLSGQVCPENSCEIPTKSADFSAILSRKIPRNLTFFLRIIRSSVYVYPATWNFSDCHDDRYPSHIGSSQVDTLVPSQNPIFLNWHTNFVVLHFCEWWAPVMDTLFVSQGCRLQDLPLYQELKRIRQMLWPQDFFIQTACKESRVP